MNRQRYHFALVSYWALFILLPVGVLLVWFGPSASNFVGYMVALVVLVVIGEHGFRRWKNLWKVHEE